MIVWLNGNFVPEEKAHIAPTDRGFTLADGVFDTLLAVDGAPVDADAHFERLGRHAAVISLTIPTSATVLHQTAIALLSRNGFTNGRYAIRTMLTRGPGARGLHLPEEPSPTFFMRAAPAPALNERPLRLIVASATRRNEHSPLSRIKSLGYGDNLLALLEAKERGADDAILLNTAGNVACGTVSNVFIREKGRLITPRIYDGALDGIARAALLTEGAVEETIEVTRLKAADEILLTNSVTGARRGVIM